MDLQVGFCPPVELVRAIEVELSGHDCVAFTRFANRQDSLFRQVLGWHGEGGALILDHPKALILEKPGYGLTREQLQLLESLDCDASEVCGVETDACVLACCFSLWDADMRPLLRRELRYSPSSHQEALAIAARQFGTSNVGSALA